MSEKKCYFKPLYEMATVISSSLEPHIVLQKIVEQTTRALDVKACSIRLLDKHKELLLASAMHGLTKGYIRKGPVEVRKSHLDAEVLTGGVPVYIKDITADERFQYPEKAKEEGLVSVLVVPLKVEGKGIGIMRIYTSSVREFNTEDKEFLMAVGHLAGLAIENARLHQALKADYELLTEYNYQVFED